MIDKGNKRYKITKDYSQGKIYRIINDINDYIYVGSTTEKLSRRMCRHRSDMKKPHNNGKMYQHIRKYDLNISR